MSRDESLNLKGSHGKADQRGYNYHVDMTLEDSFQILAHDDVTRVSIPPYENELLLNDWPQKVE